MLFNSIDFAIFLPIVFVLYWFVTNKNLKLQNLFIAVASYVFYAWWDWRFLFLLFFSSGVDFLVSMALLKEERPKNRKRLLWVSIILNLGLLGFFKYFNFFLDSFITAFTFFGHKFDVTPLNIILPVGISFYTFIALSYTIDVYRRQLVPQKDFIAYSAFVSFFPQLLAGPIERATHLLPQFYKKREFNYALAADGMRQILYGLFKKIVIADNCATFANDIFNNSQDYNGSTLAIGTLFFTIQIYCDFSGYSDIAIGLSRLFGFDIMKNFAFPYFSRDVAEFWRRWHISLSTWFRDYLYFPLGGSRGSTWKKVRNTFIIFMVSGLWHGANWTFIIWGALNAVYFLPLLLANKNRANVGNVAHGKIFPSIREVFSMLITFLLTAFAWIFFRAENVGHAFSIIGTIFSRSILSKPSFYTMNVLNMLVIPFILFFFVVEWFGRESEFGLQGAIAKWNRPMRWLMYVSILICLFIFSSKEQAFIYFQF